MSSDNDTSARRQRLEAERLALEEEQVALKRQKLAHERAELERSTQQRSSSVLQLNVGGQLFDTTLDTLAMGGMDSVLMRFVGGMPSLGGISGATRDPSGRIFIDRDPDVFKQLLRWLRGQPLTLDPVARGQLLSEAEYFQLHRLRYQLLGEYDPYTLSAADQRMRTTRRGALDALTERRDGAVESAQALLIDVLADLSAFTHLGEEALAPPTVSLPRLFTRFQRERGREVGAPLNASLELSSTAAAEAAGDRASVRVRTEPRPSTSFAALDDMEGRAKRARLQATSAAYDVAKRAGFERRMHLLGGPLLEGLDMSHLCIAGGAVLRALMMGEPSEEEEIERARQGASDIDFFVVADDELIARAAFDRLFAHLKARYAVRTRRSSDP